MTLPHFSPMLAVPWDRPFDDDDWAFEPKLDGVRAIAEIENGGVRLRSRAANDLTASYPELSTLGELPSGTVLDGEIIAYDQAGRPSFERLQGRMHRSGPSPIAISYVAFDLIALGGSPVVDEPLEGRVDRLGSLNLPDPTVQSTMIRGAGIALFEATADQELEGIMAKRRGSPYRPGERSPHWRKIPHFLRTRAVVGGFTEGKRGRGGQFGALLLGLWDGPALRYIGSVGTGFDRTSAMAIRHALDEMTTSDSPFGDDPAIPPGRFVNPHLVAEIAFKQWTAAGRLRAPSFKGFSDRPHAEVTWDSEHPGTR